MRTEVFSYLRVQAGVPVASTVSKRVITKSNFNKEQHHMSIAHDGVRQVLQEL